MAKYCDIDPKFPKTAWFGFILREIRDVKLIIPIIKMHSSKKEELACLRMMAKAVKYKKDEWGPMLIKIKLAKKFKNKREYWTREKDLVKIGPWVMTLYYLDVVKYPKLYQILAVGAYMDKKGN